MKIEEYLRSGAQRIEKTLEDWLSETQSSVEARLWEAMRYSLLSGGKRIRPLLVLAAGEAVGASPEPLLPFACAVEMVHTYSLIHDDLPAMDDDDLRRGRPSNHVVYGEGMAILAGDALLTEAFALMGRSRAGQGAGIAAERALEAIRELAIAAGAQGMVGGQAADLLAEGAALDLASVESIHRRKTGALFRASLRIGGIAGQADAATLERLTLFGETIGFAFQVADDLLDAAGNTTATGKAAQRDRERGKSTVPGALGMADTRRLLRDLLDAGLSAIVALDRRADPLREIARAVVGRALQGPDLPVSEGSPREDT